MDSPTNSKKKKALNKKELWAEFLLFCDRSGFTLISADPDGTYPCFTDVVLSFNGSRFNLSVNLRNISSAYLPKDPTVKRRQVQSLDRELLPKNTKDHLSLLLGLYENDGKAVLGAWNPFRFCGHKTVRSCYIRQETIDQALLAGHATSKYGLAPVYACTDTNLHWLLTNYTKDNCID